MKILFYFRNAITSTSTKYNWWGKNYYTKSIWASKVGFFIFIMILILWSLYSIVKTWLKSYYFQKISFSINLNSISLLWYVFRKDHKKVEFELHEVYGVDVYVSSGDGKSREKDVRTTVYKKSEQTYALKMKASRSKIAFFQIQKLYLLYVY